MRQYVKVYFQLKKEIQNGKKKVQLGKTLSEIYWGSESFKNPS
tara:strand:+ start:110 stop:238 length:129 start_codon:yes stop_codon:yes gene_type:complete